MKRLDVYYGLFLAAASLLALSVTGDWIHVVFFVVCCSMSACAAGMLLERELTEGWKQQAIAACMLAEDCLRDADRAITAAREAIDQNTTEADWWKKKP